MWTFPKWTSFTPVGAVDLSRKEKEPQLQSPIFQRRCWRGWFWWRFFASIAPAFCCTWAGGLGQVTARLGRLHWFIKKSIPDKFWEIQSYKSQYENGVEYSWLCWFFPPSFLVIAFVRQELVLRSLPLYWSPVPAMVGNQKDSSHCRCLQVHRAELLYRLQSPRSRLNDNSNNTNQKKKKNFTNKPQPFSYIV